VSRPPAILIDAPAADATIKNITTITALAIDNAPRVESGIASLEVYVDDVRV
jgi:hypothetical protein